jgi:hemolysin activation/secretion protein
MKLRYVSLNLLSILSLLGVHELAHGAGTDAGDILRQQQEIERYKALPKNIPKPVTTESTKSAEQKPVVKISVKGFRFEGDLKSVPEDKLQWLVQEFVGKELSFDEIQQAVARINDYYLAQGFFIAKAILPKQEVVDGIIVIQINEGKLDSKNPYKIKKGDGSQELRINEGRISAYLDAALDGRVYQPDLERGLLNIADNPGVSATASVEAGTEPGTSSLLVEVIEGPIFDGSVTADNFGSPYTGVYRLTGVANLNNLSGYGDQLSLNAIQAPGEVFNMGKVGYSLPIGSDGLRASLAYTYLNFHLGGALATTPPSTGLSHNINFSLRYPIYRTALSALYWSGTYDWKSMYNEATGVVSGDKRVNVYGTSLTAENTDTFLAGGFTQAQVGIAHGRLDLSHYAQGLIDDQSDVGPQTNGNYSKTTAQLLRIQRIDERFSLQVLAAGQLAQKNLDGSEKFSLGGPAGVRAYPGGEGTGDDGYKVSVDLKYVLATGTVIGDIVPSIFYDYGRIHQNHDVMNIAMTTPNTYSLSGWGLAVEVAAAGKYTVKATWAKAIGSNPAISASGNNSDGKSNTSRVWVIGNISF